jgi:hypothetical protein
MGAGLVRHELVETGQDLFDLAFDAVRHGWYPRRAARIVILHPRGGGY